MPMQPTSSPPIAGPDPTRERESGEDRGDAVEALGVEQSDQTADDADDGEPERAAGSLKR